MSVKVTMREMLEAGIHFGHQARYWNPKMAPYIYGVRHNIHIINLEQTLPMFREVLSVIENVATKRGKILFVGTKHAARTVVREEATRAGMPYVDYRWLGGMLTNYKTIRQSIKRLKEFDEILANPEALEDRTKKEILNMVRSRDKLHANLSGIKNMGSLPDIIFVVDVGLEKIAIQEAKRLGIPIIGIADTNANPKGVDYIVPGNDDAVRAIRFYCKAIADTIIEARGAAELVEVKEEEKKVVVEAKPKKKVVTKKAAEASETEEVKQPAAEKAPAVKKTAPAKKAAVKKVVEKKPAEKKPVAKKPAAEKKTVAKKAAAKKPEAKKKAASPSKAKTVDTSK